MKKQVCSEEKAKSYAYRLLSKKDYFEEELKQKLLSKGYNLDIVQKVITDLKDKNFLNDKKLLERYRENAILKGKSSVNLKQRLYRKGISYVEISEEEELEAALNLLKKSFKKEKTFENIAKFLKNRGFRYSVIVKSFDLFSKEEE